MSMKHYTLGFVTDGIEVLLIEKKTGPPWMIGKYNGIGGTVEDGETPQECMYREAMEEAGYPISVPDKESFTFISAGGTVYVYLLMVSATFGAEDCEEGHLEWFDMDDLPENICDNLRWMIPLLFSGIDPVVLKHDGFGVEPGK